MALNRIEKDANAFIQSGHIVNLRNTFVLEPRERLAEGLETLNKFFISKRAVMKDTYRDIMQITNVLHVVVLSNEPVTEAFNDTVIAKAIAGFEHVGLERLFLRSDYFIFRLRYLVIHATI